MNTGVRKRKRICKFILIEALIFLALITIFLFGLFTGTFGIKFPEKVESLQANESYNEIYLRWDKAERAAGYYIYAEENGAFKKIKTIKDAATLKTTLPVKDHYGTHRYKVKAYAEILGINREGEASDEAATEYNRSKYVQEIPVIVYHNVISDYDRIHEHPISSLMIPKSQLEKQMAYLNKQGINTLTMDEFYEWYNGKKEFPLGSRNILITFDDGYYGVYNIAYPILKKYKLSATVFCIGVNTENAVGNNKNRKDPERSMSEDMINKLRSEYPKLQCESHTYDLHHNIKGKHAVYRSSYEQIMEDFKKNEKYGFKYIAYPWGASTRKLEKAAKDSGMKLGFLYRPSRRAKRSDRPYAVHRIKMDSNYSMSKFKKIVNCKSVG